MLCITHTNYNILPIIQSMSFKLTPSMITLASTIHNGGDRDILFSQSYYDFMEDDESLPLRLRGKRDVIFGNLKEIYKFHDV